MLGPLSSSPYLLETNLTEPSVFVVDDDDSVRDAIGMLLESVDLNYRSFASAKEFLEFYENDIGGCLVLDIRMPGMSGLELQERLANSGRNVPIIFITGHGDIPMAVEAMRKGAVDFIRKPFRDQELLDRIDEALQTDEAQRSQQELLQEAQRLVAEFTPRELEIFERVCAGQANKVMAIELSISERTVEIHRGQVMRKSGARSLAELVRLKLRLEQS
ncbi:MAG: two-component system response regulator FixJ [Limisphaerales bacterium]|jgi:two-component system response regulator FixJ